MIATDPILVTRDDLLAAEVQRLAAAAGLTPLVVRSAVEALAHWQQASMVLLGADMVGQCVEVAPPRRAGVHVLAQGDPSPELLRACVSVGVETVHDIAADSDLLELFTRARDGGEHSGQLVGVLGGVGGAGASVFAVSLAAVLARHQSTLLIDADPLGPGLDRILGIEAEKGVRWDSLAESHGRLSGLSLREALPQTAGLSVLTYPVERVIEPPSEVMREVTLAGVRAFDTVIVDIPRHLNEATSELLTRCDGVVVVSTLTLPAVAATLKLCSNLPAGHGQRFLVARGERRRAEDLARLLEMPLAVTMGAQRRLDESIDIGAGPVSRGKGALVRAASQLAAQLLGGAA